MMRFFVFAAFTCLSLTLRVQGADNRNLYCFNCTDIANPADCHTLTDCGPNVTRCRTDSTNNGGNYTFTLGCDTNQTCPIPTTTPITTQQMTTNASLTTIVSPTHSNHTTSSGVTTSPSTGTSPGSSGNVTTPDPLPVVGRRDVTQAPPDSCNKCCSSSDCNKYLCQELVVNNRTCEDAPTCQAVYDIVDNFCDDVTSAKKICKKKCDLCDLVDGNWNSWAEWSVCSTTCDNGTHTRKRVCNNPAPKGKGLNCTGDGEEVEHCNLRDCPVDGDWSDWSEWSECSVTCSVGLQRRDRNCSDPAPDADGEYCSGDSRDDRICQRPSCEQEAFDVTGVVNKTNVGNSSIAMSLVITNLGDSYDVKTGTFTCKVHGLYNFYVSIEKQFGASRAYCQLIAKDQTKMTLVAQLPNSDSRYVRAGNSVLLELEKGATVYLGSCSDPSTFTPFSTFSGFLVKPL